MARTQPEVHTLTSVRPSNNVDAHSRMVRYVVLMAVRTACFVLAVSLPVAWPLRLAFIVGAVVLPYAAVLIANAGRERPPMLVTRAPSGPPPTQPERRPDAPAPALGSPVVVASEVVTESARARRGDPSRPGGDDSLRDEDGAAPVVVPGVVLAARARLRPSAGTV